MLAGIEADEAKKEISTKRVAISRGIPTKTFPLDKQWA